MGSANAERRSGELGLVATQGNRRTSVDAINLELDCPSARCRRGRNSAHCRGEGYALAKDRRTLRSAHRRTRRALANGDSLRQHGAGARNTVVIGIAAVGGNPVIGASCRWREGARPVGVIPGHRDRRGCKDEAARGAGVIVRPIEVARNEHYAI